MTPKKPPEEYFDRFEMEAKEEKIQRANDFFKKTRNKKIRSFNWKDESWFIPKKLVGDTTGLSFTLDGVHSDMPHSEGTLIIDWIDIDKFELVDAHSVFEEEIPEFTELDREELEKINFMKELKGLPND